MKTQKLTICGWSDDTISVSGNPAFNDDLYADQGYVELSTGDVFEVDYAEAVWTITHGVNSGLVKTKHTPNDGSDGENYSDRMDVSGLIEWVELWKSWPPSDEDKARKAEEMIDNLDPEGEEMAAIYDLLVARKRAKRKRRKFTSEEK